jgi:pimeloyl-ACP methyl ester carboxylesterase
MTYLSVNGHRLFYEEHGEAEAPAVVLLHHGLGSTYSWKEQVKPLVEAGFRVIAYDRWGYGKSDTRESLKLPYFEDDLADLEACLDALRLERPALVGHSDGGTIALYFAARRPERAACLVTVAAHIYVEEKMQPSILVVQKDYQDQPRFREGLKRLHGDKVDQTFSNWFNGWRQPEMLDWNILPILSQICCPALIVQGMEDEHATPRHAQDIAAGITGAELRLLKRAGHMLPQENGREFNDMLLAFLRGNLI